MRALKFALILLQQGDEHAVHGSDTGPEGPYTRHVLAGLYLQINNSTAKSDMAMYNRGGLRSTVRLLARNGGLCKLCLLALSTMLILSS